MNALQFILVLRRLIGVVIFVPGIFVFLGLEIYEELASQEAYRREFGENWKPQFEKHFGTDSLAQSNTKIVVAIVAIPVLLTILWLIYRQIVGKKRRFHRSSRHRTRR